MKKPEPNTTEELKILEPLIKGAAEALNYFSEDELERYAKQQRRRTDKKS